MPRGRKPKQISEADLVAAVQAVESGGPLENRNILWSKVSEYLYTKGTSVSTTFVYQKIKQLGINVLTPLGKRGREGGNPAIASLRGASTKTFDTKISKKCINGMKSVFDHKYHKKIDKIKRRSFKSAVYLKCLDCCGHEASEIRRCTLYSCPLFLFLKRDSQPSETGSEVA